MVVQYEWIILFCSVSDQRTAWDPLWRESTTKCLMLPCRPSMWVFLHVLMLPNVYAHIRWIHHQDIYCTSHSFYFSKHFNIVLNSKSTQYFFCSKASASFTLKRQFQIICKNVWKCKRLQANQSRTAQTLVNTVCLCTNRVAQGTYRTVFTPNILCVFLCVTNIQKHHLNTKLHWILLEQQQKKKYEV